MSNEILLKRAEYSYRKLFKRYQLPFYPVIQSKKIVIQQQTYTLVGQHFFDKSPIITNFIVYDDAGNIADKAITDQLYQYAMISGFITALQPITQLLINQRKVATTSHDLQVLVEYELGVVPEDTYNAWINLQQIVSKVSRIHVLQESDLATLMVHWQTFWEKYENRASLLIKLKKKVIAKKVEKKTLPVWCQNIFDEARVVYSFFNIKELHVEYAPSDLQGWNTYNKNRALAEQRETALSTGAERSSHQILSVLLYVLIFIVTPLFIYLIYKKGFVNLFWLSLIYAIFFALYYTNKYRLKTAFNLRMTDIWQTRKMEENRPLFHSASISINVGTAPLYVTAVMGFIFILQLVNSGWDWLAKIYLFMTFILLAFSIWFPYSPFVERGIIFYANKVRIGHRIFQQSDLVKITVDKDDIVYHLHLTYTNEPYTIHIEKEYRPSTKAFMEEWCEQNKIDLLLAK